MKAAYLQAQHGIPDKRGAQIRADLYGVKITSATLASLIAKKRPSK